MGWERGSQAHQFCNLTFPSLKERFFPWKRTFPGWKVVFIYGNTRSWAAIFQPCPSYPVVFSCRTVIVSWLAGRIL